MSTLQRCFSVCYEDLSLTSDNSSLLFSKFDVHDVSHDGSCFCDAIGHQLLVNQYTSHQLTAPVVKQQLVDFISSNETLKELISNRL